MRNELDKKANFAEIVKGLFDHARTKPEELKGKYQRLLAEGEEPGLALRLAHIMGDGVASRLEAGLPISPRTQLLMRDERTVIRDGHIADILGEIDPDKPLSLGQIAQMCSERCKKQVKPWNIASGLVLLLQDERFEDKYVLARVSVDELYEDPEMCRRADENEPKTMTEALTLMADAWHDRLGMRRLTNLRNTRLKR